MSLKSTTENGLLIIRLEGPLNALTSPAIQAEIEVLVAESDDRLVLDLSAVPFVSSHGLRVIIQTARLIPPPAKLVVCGLQMQIQQMFKLAGLDRLVDIHASAAFIDHVA